MHLGKFFVNRLPTEASRVHHENQIMKQINISRLLLIALRTAPNSPLIHIFKVGGLQHINIVVGTEAK